MGFSNRCNESGMKSVKIFCKTLSIVLYSLAPSNEAWALPGASVVYLYHNLSYVSCRRPLRVQIRHH
jgi:hypothetical protein